MLKTTLLFEIIAFFLYVGMYSYNHRDTINQNVNDKLTDDMQKKIFYCIVCLWLFIACIYFLWHSINRSIVVELIAFSTSLLILNFFLIYRLTMILFFQEGNEFPNITKTGIDASDRIEAFVSLCGLGLLIIFTPLQQSVIPSIYEDIKDNIFLALGGSNALWENFYNMALSKSIIKLDLIGNLEFWTTYFFILYNFQV